MIKDIVKSRWENYNILMDYISIGLVYEPGAMTLFILLIGFWAVPLMIIFGDHERVNKNFGPDRIKEIYGGL